MQKYILRHIHRMKPLQKNHTNLPLKSLHHTVKMQFVPQAVQIVLSYKKMLTMENFIQENRGRLRSMCPMFTAANGAWYLVNYVPGYSNHVSTSLIDYKKGQHKAIREWNTRIVEQVASLELNIDCILRALGSREQYAKGGTGLDHLGFLLSGCFDAPYRPGLLTKERPTRMLHQLTKWKRTGELEEVYRFDNDHGNVNKGILVIDDIITTGATFNAIMKSIRKDNKRLAVYLLAIARTK